MAKDEKIQVMNVLQPGKTYSANRAKYDDMKTAMLKILPAKAPGLTVEDVGKSVRAHLSPVLFPGGEKSGWWVKCVQLDLEARGLVSREATKPLRLHKAS
jgi:hypothetical protein